MKRYDDVNDYFSSIDWLDLFTEDVNQYPPCFYDIFHRTIAI